MNIKIDLLYFEGCPNVDKARNHIKEALSKRGLPLKWNEIDINDKNTASHLKGFPSPTVLINGTDIETGLSKLSGTSSCQVTGAPSIDQILKVLQKNSSKKGMFAFIATIPATVIAVFPSVFCPACYPALAALLGSLGLGFFASEAILQPLTIIFLLIALFGLFYESTKIKRYESFIIGTLGAVGIYAGHYWFSSSILTYGSVALLIGASIWNLIIKKRSLKQENMCSSCKP
ncbi:MAG: MerC family mercury resistance protein [Deltaproteobacteria bacterium]|nr:MerC family mercury resistance protein [Deltaproteobacteria bacterium]